jgi:hypothetical protein
MGEKLGEVVQVEVEPQDWFTGLFSPFSSKKRENHTDHNLTFNLLAFQYGNVTCIGRKMNVPIGNANAGNIGRRLG